VLKLFAEFCHFGAQLFMTLTDFLDLLLETGIAMGRAAVTALLVMALHFFGPGANAASLIMKSGLLEVHGSGHEVRERGSGIGVAAATGGHGGVFAVAMRLVSVFYVFTGSPFTGGTSCLARLHFGRGGTTFRTTFRATFGTSFGTTLIARGTGLFATGFGFVSGFFRLGASFGAGSPFLGVDGEEGDTEGGGDGGTEEGAREI
jgi:hypothetical protein